MTKERVLDYARPMGKRLRPTVWCYMHAAAVALVVFGAVAVVLAVMVAEALVQRFDAGESVGLLGARLAAVAVPPSVVAAALAFRARLRSRLAETLPRVPQSEAA